ncbi:MAG: type IV pilus modification PilV family protein [Bdellovibrionota bacterium]
MIINKNNKIKKTRCEKGFTLVEIAIAVFMLATALVVMLGLEQSNIARTINDQNRKVALGLARKVMAAIELEKVSINVDEEKDEELIVFFSQNDIPFDEEDKDILDKFKIKLKATSPKLIGIEQENIIKLIELKISWGETNREELNIIRYTENI